MTQLSQFRTQVDSLSPVTVRCLARWQRTVLAKRNPHFTTMLDTMPDAELCARYLEAAFNERQRLAAQTEKAKRERTLLRAAASVSPVQSRGWNERTETIRLRLV
jgi:hypothetical protein